MNISTLSQQLNMSVQEVRDKMAELGFKVSPRQRKIENNIARVVIEKLDKTVTEAVVDDANGKVITIPAQVSVKDLATKMKVSVVDIVKLLIQNGVMASINEQIDFDTASIVASDFGFELTLETSSSKLGLSSGYVEQVIKKELENPLTKDKFVVRPPIVAVMGHVDHGKTTLLDNLRKTNVAGGEAGAITQHIGAYQIKHNSKTITFLDTPGHEAFTQMRARGANVTDLIILVVAADDGVKPQTLEVINRARLANVPMIVAINKIDKPSANLDKVKQQLSEHGVIIEEWGGKTIAVPVSAKSGEGLDKLLDMTLLLSEVEDYKANPKGQTVGTVIESHISKGRGSSATVIVQNGTLKVGDFVVAGGAYAKIRTLEKDNGDSVNSATPSTPVVVIGLSDLPSAGDIFKTVQTLDEAREIAREYQIQQRTRRLMHTGINPVGKTLNVILKADVDGSLEAIEQSLEELKTRSEEVSLAIIDKGIGDISESDILRAESSGAVILGFSVKISPPAALLVKSKKVDIQLYSIIYELLEDVTKAIVAMMSPEIIRKVTATAKVLAIFKTTNKDQIIGGRVEDGVLKNDSEFSIKRGGEIIGGGRVKELQRNKQSSDEVMSGSEFGSRVEMTHTILVDDVLEFFVEEVIAKKLSS